MAAVVEGVHPLIEVARGKLPMRHDHRHLGDVGRQPVLHLGQVRQPRNHEEALPAAILLAQQRLANGDAVEFRHIGADRQPVDRRRRDDRQITHTRKRQLQRARDRRRGQRQDVNVRAQLLQPLLVGDAEMLLLIDDQQPDILELDLLGQHRMGADDDIDAAIRQSRPRRRGILGADEARQRPHDDRRAAEPLGKAAIVLAREQGRRRDHRHLPSALCGDEGSAHGDLGLAEADIADDQPVHRPASGEVRRDIGNRRRLVLGLGIGEPCRERLPVVMRGLKHRGRAQQTLGRDAHQAVGDLPDPLFQAGLSRLPSAAAQPVEQPFLVAIAAEKLDILDGQEKPVAARILDRHAVMRRARGANRFQPRIAADAMLDMDDQIAGAEGLGVSEEILGPALAPCTAHKAVAQHVLLGDDGQRPGRGALCHEPLVQRPHSEAETALALRQVPEARNRLPVRHTLVAQQAAQALAGTVGEAGDDDPMGLAHRAHMIRECCEQVDLLALSLGGEVAPDAPPRVEDSRSGRLRQHRQAQHAPLQ